MNILLKRAAFLWVPFLFLPACSSPLSALAPEGPAASSIATLWWIFLSGAAVLTVFVMVLIALGFRAPRPVSEQRWTLGLGVWFSLGVLSAMLIGGILVGERLIPKGAALEVHAHASQWDWTFRQPGPDGDTIETQRELHIPAGEPVDVVLTSEDVIHSFWVPKLAGKMDAIPGRENVLRIEATAPGIYEGRCAEFCGLGYATHRFRVIVYDRGQWPASFPLPADEGTE